MATTTLAGKELAPRCCVVALTGVEPRVALTAGAFVGAHLLSILPPRPLRVALSLWLMSMGGELCWRAVTG